MDCDANKAYGGSLGLVGSFGLSIRAERIDADAARSMRNSGIYHAGFYVELTTRGRQRLRLREEALGRRQHLVRRLRLRVLSTYARRMRCVLVLALLLPSVAGADQLAGPQGPVVDLARRH